jgi:hypothetical protein
MIPKIIHQFKREDAESSRRIREIKDRNRNWKHIVWTVEDVRKLYSCLPPGHEDVSPKIEKFIENKMWQTFEEVAKFLILFSYGGIFIDDGYEFSKGKKLRDIPFKDNDLVLFNSILRDQKKWRINETVMACSKNHRFMLHLLSYIGQENYLPKSPWDGKVLEVYTSSYITTQYALYMSLWNQTPLLKSAISHISNIDELKPMNKEVVLSPYYTFVQSPSLVMRHNVFCNKIVR